MRSATLRFVPRNPTLLSLGDSGKVCWQQRWRSWDNHVQHYFFSCRFFYLASPFVFFKVASANFGWATGAHGPKGQAAKRQQNFRTGAIASSSELLALIVGFTFFLMALTRFEGSGAKAVLNERTAIGQTTAFASTPCCQNPHRTKIN